MSDARNYVEQQYGIGNPLTSIREAFIASGKDPDRLTISDLAPVDEFHMRGREGTEELALLVGLEQGSKVLDIGSGLGGSARYLSAQYGCITTGIDLTRGYVEAATALTRDCGLEGRTTFVHGSAMELPFASGTFDVVWTEHVQMNIPDKCRYFAEISRVLVPGGRLAFHDVCRGEAGNPWYPVPWSDEPARSFIITAEGFEHALAEAGLQVTAWQDVSEACLRWFAGMRQKTREKGPSRVGLHILMGETARQKSENLIRNLEEKRLVAIQGVALKR